MVSNIAAFIFFLIIAISVGFTLWSLNRRKRLQFIHKLYLVFCIVVAIWAVTMLGIKYTDPGNKKMLFIWDSISYIGVSYASVLMLMINMAFIKGTDKMTPKWYLLLIIPTITNIMVWTNPFHHLHYVVFSVIRNQIVFGPYLYVSGAYSYICLISATFFIVRFAIKNQSRLYLMQSIVFVFGQMAPLSVSLVATLGIIDVSIAATPLSFAVTVVCHYIAIYRLHVLDIKPVATQHVLDWISDCYLIISDEGLVISYNQPFRNVFGMLFGISENRFLKECVREEDVAGKSPVYNLLTTIESCRESKSTISYEQSINMPTEAGDFQKRYYIVDVIPLIVNGNLTGFVIIFKDITQMKKSMQQLQDGQTRMMEQERLAFLGQMVGGLAHNLKTPIMSISGCMAAVEVLVQECRESLGDNEVTTDDYLEIYSEINDWIRKTRESCTYMSDIITAIKGQTTSANTSRKSEFTIDELFKRSTLLMRHELLSSGCQLVFEYDTETQLILTGDINNLIQVLNNLISNAIDAQRQKDSDRIYMGLRLDDANLHIYVKDYGIGVDPHIRQRLFKEMITNKGTKGTGLGLYISNAVIRGKFGGQMWLEDNPDGGSIFGFSIPLENVKILRPVKERD